jgi:hypothetical protein
MYKYIITYAWTFGDLTAEVVAMSPKEAEHMFLEKMYREYGTAMLRAASFRILSIA